MLRRPLLPCIRADTCCALRRIYVVGRRVAAETEPAFGDDDVNGAEVDENVEGVEGDEVPLPFDDEGEIA